MMANTPPPSTPDEPDEWTVEGLTPPAWWHGDEEAALSGLHVKI